MSGNDSSGGNFGGGGRTTGFDCSKVSIKTNVSSPNPSVLATLKVGDILKIEIRVPTGPLLAITQTNQVLGSVFTKDPAALIGCINDGNLYEAEILKISGGDVQIIITNS